ncbi:hypothetical protein K9U39_09975 [Rhodoblastus acidophilus]|uniref:Uncharacterized protein n=1 Tax=Candidatus Rhodoblastus alkanivorans TaxID=2954117 RepID=A0ABS9Z9B6_9HYPH|nr:hypothetical protein [Candidatus Rhodoblastus alkanivorans]MCI4679495.1 hypothetical protein [Candidatus Rhodoblastus alkanivorans]MCI4683940.1 hypothetical protein [Candidatus Rhodoblastus alkanivorans]MDI4641259.1 hypothetical protein [Rhodoblastus acidophilus]
MDLDAFASETPAANDANDEDFRYDTEDDGADAPAAGSAEETARYISDMVGSLALIARDARLDLLNYLLEMARVEAEMQARQTETPFDED